jgi:hypothetical protein
MDYSKLNRRELIAMIQALSAVTVIPGCKDDTGSDFKDLTMHTSITKVPAGRKDMVVQKYRMADWVAAGNGQQECFEQLAAIPDVYLDYLHKRSQDKSVNEGKGFNIEYGGESTGMCWFDDEGAIRITLNGITFATIHEVGHGVETMAHKLQNITDITNLRERTYSSVVSSPEAQYIRDYAKSNSKELFADGFSSFYRSPKSRADMQKMPITFKWLQSILVAPVNFGPGESTAGYIKAGTPPAAANTAMSQTSQATNPSTTPTTTPTTTPSTTSTTTPSTATAPPTTVGGVNLCSAPTNQLVAILCQLSSSLGGGAGLTLTVGDEMILPTVGQFLTAFDTYLMMAKLSITESEAKSVKIYLDKTLVQTGIEKDPYSGAQDIFSAKFKVPTNLTPAKDYKIMKLALYHDGRLLIGTPVKVSRNSLCGNLDEFKKSL